MNLNVSSASSTNAVPTNSNSSTNNNNNEKEKSSSGGRHVFKSIEYYGTRCGSLFYLLSSTIAGYKLDHSYPIIVTSLALFIYKIHYVHQNQSQHVTTSIRSPSSTSTSSTSSSSSSSSADHNQLLMVTRTQRLYSIDRGYSPAIHHHHHHYQAPQVINQNTPSSGSSHHSQGHHANPSPTATAGIVSPIQMHRVAETPIILPDDDDVSDATQEDKMEYPFDTKDTKRNIQYTMDSEGSNIIKGATLYKLIEKLTEESGKGASKYAAPFLLTYRSFTTPKRLLELLMKRYQVPIPKDMTPEQEQEFITKYKKHIQLRVWYVLKVWTETHFQDFKEDDSVLSMYQEFLKTMMNELPQLAQQLVKILERQLPGFYKSSVWERTSVKAQDIPEPVLPAQPEPWTLLDISPLEAARQLTLIEYELYHKIQPKECLNQNWNKKNSQEVSPHIVALIQRFNKMSKWVITEIMKESNINRRAQIITAFIRIAAECRRLQNFNSMIGMVAGLSNASVSRLKKTWELVPRDLAQSFELEFSSMFAYNYKSLRDAVRRSTPPSLPYLGVYLQDLTFIEDGNSDVCPDNAYNLINFEKRLMAAKVITDLRLYQQKGYVLNVVDSIRTFLDNSLNSELLEEKQAYNISLQHEPRQPRPN